jgi:hypothetical protein
MLPAKPALPRDNQGEYRSSNDGGMTMCDTTVLRGWLTAALFGVMSAVAAIIGAIAVNGSFWSAWASPGFMLTAALMTGAALACLAAAQTALSALCACLGGACKGPCDNLYNNLRAIQVVLGIELAATLACAAASWIPFAPIPVMTAILGALIVQAALIVSAIIFLFALLDCSRVAQAGRSSG